MTHTGPVYNRVLENRTLERVFKETQIKKEHKLTEKEEKELKNASKYKVGDLISYTDEFKKRADLAYLSDKDHEEYSKTLMIVMKDGGFPYIDGVRLVVYNQWRGCFQRPMADIVQHVYIKENIEEEEKK